MEEFEAMKLLEEVFVCEFVKTFESKVQEDNDILTGKIQNTSKKAKLFDLFVDIFFNKFIEYIKAIYVPLMWVIDLLPIDYIKEIINGAIKFINEKTASDKFSRLEQFHKPELQSSIRKILVVAGCNIFKNYEQQLTSIYVDDKKKEKALHELAKHSVDRIFNYYTNKQYQSERVSVEIIVRGLLLGKSNKCLLKLKFPDMEENFVTVDDIYNQPGLIVDKSDGTAFEYYVKDPKNNQVGKYGYRRPFSWEKIEYPDWKSDHIKHGLNSYVYKLTDSESWRKILKRIIDNNNNATTVKCLEIISNEHFTGRTEHLINLDNVLGNNLEYELNIGRNDKTKIKPIVICGLGGVGKSELIRKYISEYKHGDVHCVWFDATSLETLQQSLCNLITNNNRLSKIKIIDNEYVKNEKDKDENGLIRDINKVLRDVYDKLADEKSLFIFDNVANSKSDYVIKFISYHHKVQQQKNINEITKPHIIITSRYSNWQEEIQKIELNELNIQEACSYIKTSLVSCEDLPEMIEQLADTLNCIPLGLLQAVSYIKTKNQTDNYNIQKYLEKFQEEKEKLLKSDHYLQRNIIQQSVDTIWVTWEVTLDKIKNSDNGNEAIQIFDIMSCFGTNDIPRDIFYKVDNFDEDSVISAVDLLVTYSMINSVKNSKQGILNVHDLVREVMYSKLEGKEEHEEALNIALSIINHDETNTIDDNHIISIWMKASKFPDLIEGYYNYKCKYGLFENTPLHLLAKNCDFEPFEDVFNRIAEVQHEAIQITNKFNETILHYAILGGNLKIINFVLQKGVNPNNINVGQWSCIHFAVYYGNKGIVETLVQHRNIDITLTTTNGFTALHLSTRSGNKEITEILINKLREDNKLDQSSLSPKTNWGFTPLHLACKFNHSDVIQILLDTIPDVNSSLECKTNYDFTPMHFATQKGNIGIIKLLLSSKTKINISQILRLKDRFTNTPFMNIVFFIDLSYKSVIESMEDKQLKEYFNYALQFKDDITSNFKTLANLIEACNSRNFENICRLLNDSNLEDDIIRLTDVVNKYTVDKQELFNVKSLVGKVMGVVCGIIKEDIKFETDEYMNLRKMKDKCNEEMKNDAENQNKNPT